MTNDVFKKLLFDSRLFQMRMQTVPQALTRY
jgi:hypothetical protein